VLAFRTVTYCTENEETPNRTPAGVAMTLEDKGGSNEDVLSEIGLSADLIASLRDAEVI
jgi:hypothetical protein